MGQKFAAYDASGAITGFYDSEDSPAPEGLATLAISDAQWQAAIAQPACVQGGALVARPPAAPTPAQVEAQVVAAVQDRLDAFARTRGYDSILSACTYATSTQARFQAEGAYCVQARDAHWAACYAVLAEVQAGTRAMPTVAEVLAAMPALTWPQ